MCSCAVKIWFIFTGVLEQFRKIVAGTEWDIWIGHPDVPAFKFHNSWHSSQAKLKPGLPISHVIKGFDVFWELCLKCSCFGYIIAFQLGYKVYQIGIVKSFQFKPCRTSARFDAANLEPAPILKTSSVCVVFQISPLPSVSTWPHVATSSGTNSAGAGSINPSTCSVALALHELAGIAYPRGYRKAQRPAGIDL